MFDTNWMNAWAQQVLLVISLPTSRVMQPITAFTTPIWAIWTTAHDRGLHHDPVSTAAGTGQEAAVGPTVANPYADAGGHLLGSLTLSGFPYGHD